MMRNMVTALFSHERIQTTEPKAKELRGVAEKLITMSKKAAVALELGGKGADVAARRRARRTIQDREVLYKLFSELAERYATRPGGYTRIIKAGRRAGDNAAMAIIELVKTEYRPREVTGTTSSEEAATTGKPAVKNMETSATAQESAKLEEKVEGAAELADEQPVETSDAVAGEQKSEKSDEAPAKEAAQEKTAAPKNDEPKDG